RRGADDVRAATRCLHGLPARPRAGAVDLDHSVAPRRVVDATEPERRARPMARVAVRPEAGRVPVPTHRGDETDTRETRSIEVAGLREVREHDDGGLPRNRGEIVGEPLVLWVVVAVTAQTFAVVRDEVHATPVERVVERTDRVAPRRAPRLRAPPVTPKDCPLERLTRFE